MKKRILALALAGTTAFSVFGAAMSASAAINVGTDFSAQYVSTNDIYKRYTPVATTITADYTAAVEATAYRVENADGSEYLNLTLNTTTKEITVHEGGWMTGVLTLEDDHTFEYITNTDDNGKSGYVYKGERYSSLKNLAEAMAKAGGEGYKAFPLNAVAENGYVTIETKTGDKMIHDWSFDGSTSSDTTIYPWTVETYYADKNGAVRVDEAVEDATVYLFDFIPYNSTIASAGAIASTYNNKGAKEASTLIDTNASGATVWTAEKGKGGSYGIRKEVVDQYKDFLYGLQLIGNDRYDYIINDEDVFKGQYRDLYVSGYVYDQYTGKVVDTWKTDVYNLDELFADIYDSRDKYETMNTSEMMYLMQQYDKYVGDYINKEEVEKDAWGDLLVSILEGVSEDDFVKGTYYKQFARAAEDAIDNYEDAVSSAQIKDAERAMYSLIASTSYKTASATSAKADLNGSINALYFNAAYAEKEYEVKGNILGANAALKDYAYIAAVTTVKDPVYGTISFDRTATTSTGHYALYPASDYYQYGNNAAQFPGNDVRNGTAATSNVTDEYEWFLNVYELATSTIATGNIPSVLSAVSAALDEAVAGLEVTDAATATAKSALDEMIAHYEGKLDMYVQGNGVVAEDFAEKYYAPYEAALAYADVAEGAAQVANARRMVAVAAEALTYQGAQATVTKNDIKTVEAAIKEAQTALKAIKEDKNYNAAQVTALNKAIATAEGIVAIWNGTVPTYNMVNHAAKGYVGDKDSIVKSDITGAIEAIETAIKGSTVVQGWYNNGTAWQYGEGDNYLNDGWHFIDKVWYYFDEDATAKQSEWAKIDGTWYYFNSNAGAARGWCKVDNEWYYFDQNTCAMKTGWVKVDGNWYYLAASGKMTTGWVQVDGKWYYMSKESNSLGQMLANTTVEGYKLGADGAMIEK